MERLQIWRIIELWIQCRMILHIWSLLILLHWQTLPLTILMYPHPTNVIHSVSYTVHYVYRGLPPALYIISLLCKKQTLEQKNSQTEDPLQNNTHLHFTDSPDIYPSATQTGASLCTSQPEEQVNPLLCRSQHHHPHSSSAPSVDRKTLVHPLLKNYSAPSVENSCVPSTEEPNRNLQCSVSIEKVQRVYRKGTHNTSGFSSREISAVFVWAPRLPTRALFLLFFL